MPQTSANVTAGTDAKASDFNKVVADLAEIYSGGPGVPVGGILWWWSNNTVPTNYMICTGATVSDAGSPLNGLVIPNLVNKFVRGVSNQNLRSAGQSGGSDTINLNHSHTVNAHSHDMGNHTHGYSGTTSTGNFHSGQSSNVYTVQTSTTPPGHDHSFSGTTGGPSTNSTGNTSTGTDLQLSGSQSVVPAYVGLVPIIRIK